MGRRARCPAPCNLASETRATFRVVAPLDSPGDALVAALRESGLEPDDFRRIEDDVAHYEIVATESGDLDLDFATPHDDAARALYGQYVQAHGRDAFYALQELSKRLEHALELVDGTDAWSRLHRVWGVACDALEIADEASRGWSAGEDEYADPAVPPGDDPEADAERYFEKREQRMQTAYREVFGTRGRVLVPSPGLRAVRPTARRRRETSRRSSARSGDSGDSGSSEGDGEPPPPAPQLDGHPDRRRCDRALVRRLGRRRP